MSTQILLEAGFLSQRDNIKGVSENILVGNSTNIGTGCFKLMNLDGGINANDHNSDNGNSSDHSLNDDRGKNNPPPKFNIGRNSPSLKNPFSPSELRVKKEDSNNDHSLDISPGNSNSFYREKLPEVKINDTSPQIDSQKDNPNNPTINEDQNKDNNDPNDKFSKKDENNLLTKKRKRNNKK